MEFEKIAQFCFDAVSFSDNRIVVPSCEVDQIQYVSQNVFYGMDIPDSIPGGINKLIKV
jgi:hypothetical protein